MMQKELPILSLILITNLTLGCFSSSSPADRAPAPTPASKPRPYLDAARDVGRWLRAQTVDTEHGVTWPDDALHPSAPGTSLGSGVAGRVLFFLELHAATRDPADLDAARQGADVLLAMLPAELDLEGRPPAASLYSGIGGVAFVLHEVFRASGDSRYLDGARRSIDLLVSSGAGQKGVWSPSFNDLLFGNAGTGLTLLWAARELGDARAASAATAAGRELLARGFADQGGRNWKFRQDKDFILPNFSHGAAGVGFFLASLAEANGAEGNGASEFLDAARDAATYLKAIARTDDGVFLVPYGWPNPKWLDTYELGWAHGAAGTARLFARLAAVTGEPSWSELLRRCAHGIRPGDLAEPSTVPLEDDPMRHTLRFGTGGTALFFIDLFHRGKDPDDLDHAGRLVDRLLEAATRDAQGLRWLAPGQSWLGESSGEPTARTGYFHGAAGYGLVLLRLDAALGGEDRTIRLPDDPFGT